MPKTVHAAAAAVPVLSLSKRVVVVLILPPYTASLLHVLKSGQGGCLLTGCVSTSPKTVHVGKEKLCGDVQSR